MKTFKSRRIRSFPTCFSAKTGQGDRNESPRFILRMQKLKVIKNQGIIVKKTCCNSKIHQSFSNPKSMLRFQKLNSQSLFQSPQQSVASHLKVQTKWFPLYPRKLEFKLQIRKALKLSYPLLQGRFLGLLTPRKNFGNYLTQGKHLTQLVEIQRNLYSLIKLQES
jgi:hypothetical protein